jgi:glycosyltransferase involved in cell wall biosynthesis
MKLHTVFITYNRLELTKRAIASYLETVTVSNTIHVYDNGSTDGTVYWLGMNAQSRDYGGKFDHLTIDENRYPGYATNRGWEEAPAGATHLHRADNDFEFLPGWCEEVERIFQNPKVGQVGLRTDEEEQYVQRNTGGNCVIRRALWDQGLRWDERPWPEIRKKGGDGWTEDSFFSPAVKKMGYTWTRVKRPCIRNLASGDWKDPYYQESYGVRGIRPRRDDPTVPADWTGGYST